MPAAGLPLLLRLQRRPHRRLCQRALQHHRAAPGQGRHGPGAHRAQRRAARPPVGRRLPRRGVAGRAQRRPGRRQARRHPESGGRCALPRGARRASLLPQRYALGEARGGPHTPEILPGTLGSWLPGGRPTCSAWALEYIYLWNLSLALFGSGNKDLPGPFRCKLPALGGWGSRMKVPCPGVTNEEKKNVFVFPGGYEAFSASCPELCSKQSTPMGLSLPLSTSVPDSTESGCSSCSTPLYDQGGPVEILPFLYLGSAYHASRKDMLDALGITALINVSANCPNHFEGHYQYKSIPVEDNHKADISSWFNEAIDFIDSIKNAGGRVFVHCQAGISRSATICLAYLMRTNRVKLDEAFEFVKQRRSIISPNFSFMGQLLQFESQVLAPHCSAEAGSPAMAVLDRGTSTTTVFNFPVSIPVHSTNSALSYLQSPITTSPSC
ncbi:PREDICTED: dual specificity protein phosphatase 1 isoform X1 [Mandrillus leucophaeus]|uniref:dual specificity protein phosphatase 1 isoform X1 n=1 Tax=Mandrillus leucophaeus TaxID=9568 RepID=UPI0005F44102|nr:PREDICTED: dual specificity protein phosphatase 1 isoform X1 [Mandrillus leucophaeus]